MDLIKRDCQTRGGPQYVVLLAVSQAIVSHRDLSSLFHELAGRLHQVVGFDFLTLTLHDPATNILRPYMGEACDRTPIPTNLRLPVEDSPSGLVWRTQQPLLISNVAEEKRWPPHV